MDITPQSDSGQPISDDQELAKALAGVLPDVPEPAVVDTTPTTPVSPVTPDTNPVLSPSPTFTPQSDNLGQTTSVVSTTTVPSELDQIKKDALAELRPLIGKIELPPEEKFDTYLMLIRSTDDSSLIGPAHVIAQSITDETRRAEAFLDIIKEIDYLSRSTQ